MKIILKRIKGYAIRIVDIPYYLWRKCRYREYHFSDTIKKPLFITPKYITLKENVLIWYNARIEGVSKYNNHFYEPEIVFHKGVKVNQNIHLTCANSIIIGENTSISANVSITDIHHSYTDVSEPIEKQDIEVKYVEIGPDCKIYNNAVILPGVKIGKHVTIGANSVVTSNIPDYCVAVGAPAYIVKRYDHKNKIWRRTDKTGAFVLE